MSIQAIVVKWMIVSFLFLQTNTFAQTSATTANTQSCDSVPAMNAHIYQFVKNNIGNKVARGECWDLAAEPLKLYQATWDKMYVFGRAVNYQKECVYPGDIIQFEGIEIRYSEGDRHHEEYMEHHTAVVYKVISKGVYEIAHQNTSKFGRTVGVSKLDLTTIVSGKYIIYRPHK